MKYLFLCARGENRSRTAAAVCSNICQERRIEVDIDYSSMDNLDLNDPQIRKYLFDFNHLFVMEESMQRKLMDFGIDQRKISCLNIEDMYKRFDPGLVRILENSLTQEISFLVPLKSNKKD